MQHDTTIDGHTGTLMTVEDFKESCVDGLFIDYDGMGDMVKDGKIVEVDAAYPYIYPSIADSIPDEITHILWYNR